MSNWLNLWAGPVYQDAMAVSVLTREMRRGLPIPLIRLFQSSAIS